MAYFSAVSDPFGSSHSRPSRDDAVADDGDERVLGVGRLVGQDDQRGSSCEPRATAASAPTPAAAFSSRSHGSTHRTDE
jgi:hypothetical protein